MNVKVIVQFGKIFVHRDNFDLLKLKKEKKKIQSISASTEFEGYTIGPSLGLHERMGTSSVILE